MNDLKNGEINNFHYSKGNLRLLCFNPVVAKVWVATPWRGCVQELRGS